MTEPEDNLPTADDTLILVVTQECNLSCDYCPVDKKTGRMPFEVASKAIDMFLSNPAASGKIRFFGGEPLLYFPFVRESIEYAMKRTSEKLSYDITTNGLLLDGGMIGFLRSNPEIELIVSIDGTEQTHLLHRPGTDSYSWAPPLANELSGLPNITVNKVVAPDTAVCLADDFLHIVKMGFCRINILPAYYTEWTREQIRNLRLNLDALLKIIATYRNRGKQLSIKNTYVTGSRPLFNRAIVVDTDGSCFSSNIFMHHGFSTYRERLKCGDIQHCGQPADRFDYEDKILKEVFPSEILEATYMVDREISGFVEKLLEMT